MSLLKNKKEQLENLGMHWEGNLNFSIPKAESQEFALMVYKTNIVSITWNCMSTLERNPTTLPQTEAILRGESVTGITIDELLQVKRYGDAAKKLVQILSDKTFMLNAETACGLHSLVGKEEALISGKFRESTVTIRDVGYVPPDASNLSDIAKKGFDYIDKQVSLAPEKAFATFLFMSRSQFFYDVNKRTASLMMNGALVSEGYYPVTIMNRDSEEFHTKLTDFYNTGNATQMMNFFEKSTREMYKLNAKENKIAAS